MIAHFYVMLQLYMTSFIYILLATFVCTLLGGLVAFRYKQYSHVFSGLTAGVLIAIVFLEIIPEIFEMNSSSTLPLIWVVGGFVLFHILEKIFSLHHTHSELEHEEHDHTHHHLTTRTTGAWALIGHSFIDGLGIGLAYQVSPLFGSLFAVGVIAHDFSDGFNTVALTAHKSKKVSTRYLFVDAIAPSVGALVGMSFVLPEHILAIVLSLFAGILLYVATGDVLPEAHCAKKRHTAQHISAFILGVVYIAVIVGFLGGH